MIADEINRASPKTQSALLEVMEERHVTVDGVRHPVPRPFLVVATQNPVEMDGTYRLPEAQLDRFLMKLTIGYPEEPVEVEVLRGAAAGRSPDYLGAVTDTDTVGQLIRLAQRVFVADPLYSYAVRLAAVTRDHKQVRVGVSPRGVIALTRAAQAYALTDGRAYVIPEDIKALIEPVFAHRLLLAPDAAMRGVTPAEVLRGVVDSVPVPAPAQAGTGPRRARLTRAGDPRGFGLWCRSRPARRGFRVGLSGARRAGLRVPCRLAGAVRFVAWRPHLDVTREVAPDRVMRGDSTVRSRSATRAGFRRESHGPRPNPPRSRRRLD